MPGMKRGRITDLWRYEKTAEYRIWKGGSTFREEGGIDGSKKEDGRGVYQRG
jgi:hypothetical protein